MSLKIKPTFCWINNNDLEAQDASSTILQYIPPFFIYSTIKAETPPPKKKKKKKSLPEKILSLEPSTEEIVKIPPPNVMEDLQEKAEDDDNDDESSEEDDDDDGGDDESSEDDEGSEDDTEIGEAQQLKARLVSLLNFEFKDEILSLMDELYNSVEIDK